MTFVARREALQQQNVGMEIFGPRSLASTRRIVDYARRNRLPYTWRDPEHSDDNAARAVIEPLDPAELPLVRLPGGKDLRNPSIGEVSRELGIGLELAAREEVDLVVIGGGPAGLGAAVYGASEGLETLVVESTALGGQAGTSRRIENYLGFPAGISGSELTSRAVTQARKFHARTATPYRAIALEPGADRHTVRLEDDHEISASAVVLATGAQYRRLPVDDLADYEGSACSTPPAHPRRERCGRNGSASSAVATRRPGGCLAGARRRARDAAAPPRRPARDDVGLPRARARTLRRRVRDRSEVAHLHGADGELDAVTLHDGERLPFAFLFLFLGAAPCTDWLGDVVDATRRASC